MRSVGKLMVVFNQLNLIKKLIGSWGIMKELNQENAICGLEDMWLERESLV